MFTKTATKTILPATLTPGTYVHASVYSSRKLSDAKAIGAAAKELRAHGFIVTELTTDRVGDRAAMVTARIQ